MNTLGHVMNYSSWLLSTRLQRNTLAHVNHAFFLPVSVNKATEEYSSSCHELFLKSQVSSSFTPNSPFLG